MNLVTLSSSAVSRTDITGALAAMALLLIFKTAVDGQMEQILKSEQPRSISSRYHQEILKVDPAYWVQLIQSEPLEMIDDLNGSVITFGFRPQPSSWQPISFGYFTESRARLRVKFQPGTPVNQLGIFLTDSRKLGSIVGIRTGQQYKKVNVLPQGQWIHFDVSKDARDLGEIELTFNALQNRAVVSALMLYGNES